MVNDAMSLQVADDGQGSSRFLPAVTPSSRQGVSARGPRGRAAQQADFDIDGAEGFDDDRVEIRALDEADDLINERLRSRSRNLDETSARFNFNRSRQDRFESFGGPRGEDVEAEAVAAAYTEVAEVAQRPFYLGQSIDIVG